MSALQLVALIAAANAASVALVLGGLRLRHRRGRGRPGRAAPGFALPSLDGAARIGPGNLLAAGRPLLLAFVDGEHPASLSLVRHAARWQREHGGELTVAVVASRDGWTRVAGVAEAADLCTLLLDHDGTAAHAYGLLRLPAAVLVDRAGRQAAPPAVGIDAIEMLLDAALGRPLQALRWGRPLPLLGPPIGMAVPDVIVRGPDGTAVALGDVLDGEPAVLLLWDRECPACADACDELHAWPDDGPRLVAVGAAPDDRLPAPLLVDADRALAAALDAPAPAAILVDGDGRVAAPLARGAEAILTLARPPALA